MIFGRQICKLCKQLPDKLRVHTIPAKYGEGGGRYEKLSNPGTRTLPDHPTYVMQNWNLTTALQICQR